MERQTNKQNEKWKDRLINRMTDGQTTNKTEWQMDRQLWTDRNVNRQMDQHIDRWKIDYQIRRYRDRQAEC